MRQLYKNSIALYKMQLLAGQEGLGNLVQWVHIIEDAEVGGFLHGEELVFTSGLLNDGEQWFPEIVKNVYQSGASAFVVNIGPYIKEVPQEILDYCDEKKMPLFSIPWETRMVDMTRDFCQRIFKNESLEENAVTALKNIIFGTGTLEENVATMTRYGYKKESVFNFAAITFSDKLLCEDEYQWEKLKRISEKTIRSANDTYLSFSYDGCRMLLFVDSTEEEEQEILEQIISATKREQLHVQIGLGSNHEGFHEISTNFENAISALHLAEVKKREVVCYDHLDIYKLIMGIEDKNILREYYDRFIGPLEKYDEENETKLVEILDVYLENNGSPQMVADKLYLHRNTVNNQLKKIEKVTGYSPFELTDKLKFYMAYYVKEML